ncbi:MAG: metal-dependent transcriptional regulator [Candidatus Bathyarchaeia archaeon]
MIERAVTPVVEEYLENIFKLQEEFGRARTKELADRLGVTLGTVTNMIEDLERQGLVIHEMYRGVRLTGEGRRIALDVIRRHRLSERLLTDLLKMPMSKVHKAACELEHSLSEDVIKPLERALGHPKTCPHGNPIPTSCGGIIEDESIPISKLSAGDSGVIKKITEEEEELLQYLCAMGILPETSVIVNERISFDGSFKITVGGIDRSISRKVASVVWVRKNRVESL